MFRNRLAAGLTVCALALVLAPNQVEAQVKPFKITGGGIAPMGLPLPGEPGRPNLSSWDPPTRLATCGRAKGRLRSVVKGNERSSDSLDLG